MVEFGLPKCTINVIVSEKWGQKHFYQGRFMFVSAKKKMITRMLPAKWKIQKIFENLIYLQFA